MANNRLMFCEVNENKEIVNTFMIAKHLGGSWYCCYNDAQKFVDGIDDFFSEAFINGNGIALIDEYMDVPLPELYVYNKRYEGNGHWEFIKDESVAE